MAGMRHEHVELGEATFVLWTPNDDSSRVYVDMIRGRIEDGTYSTVSSGGPVSSIELIKLKALITEAYGAALLAEGKSK